MTDLPPDPGPEPAPAGFEFDENLVRNVVAQALHESEGEERFRALPPLRIEAQFDEFGVPEALVYAAESGEFLFQMFLRWQAVGLAID